MRMQIGEHTVLIDDEFYPLVSRYKWHVYKECQKYYAYTNVYIGKKQYKLGIHRLIKGMTAHHVDHINRNPLDNRLSNLRFATAAQNATNKDYRRNKCGFRGVYKRKTDDYWSAQITHHGKKLTKRYFKTAEEAAKQYDIWSREFHGEFGVTNFPIEAEGIIDG